MVSDRARRDLLEEHFLSSICELPLGETEFDDRGRHGTIDDARPEIIRRGVK